MKRSKVLTILLVIAVIITSLSFSMTAFADNVDWHYDEAASTLYITGTGKMDNYEDAYSIPWAPYANDIQTAVIEEGVTTIGDYAFSGLKSLTDVQIADTVTAVGANAFASCRVLNHLTFSKSIKEIADSSFAYNGLEEKNDFILYAPLGSYAVSFAFDNGVEFSCPSVSVGQYDVEIYVNGMNAVFPFTPKHSGTYKFYSSGTYDTKGFLYNSAHEQLSYNDDGPSLSNGNFSITYDLQKGQTYYINACLFSKGRVGSFKLNIEAVSFTFEGTVNAMLLPDGTASDIVLADALVDGKPAGSSFKIDITGGSKTVLFEYNGRSKSVEITPDTDSAITFVACDVNNDGYVNAKDYAIMRKTSSPFIELFDNFMNSKL